MVISFFFKGNKFKETTEVAAAVVVNSDFKIFKTKRGGGGPLKKAGAVNDCMCL
jgi:hypothetical protein